MAPPLLQFVVLLLCVRRLLRLRKVIAAFHQRHF